MDKIDFVEFEASSRDNNGVLEENMQEINYPRVKKKRV